jgi:hypothetical protein
MSSLLGMDAAKGEADAYRFNASIKERNAQSIEREAEWQQIVGGIEKQDFYNDARKFNAQVGAVQRANGWVNSGTALDVYLESIKEQELSVSRMDTASIAKERQFNEQSINARMGAELDQIYARNAITAGKYRAASTVAGWGFKGASLLMGAI